MAYLSYLHYDSFNFSPVRRVTEWRLMNRLARALMLLVFHLLYWGVKPFWPVVGFPMLNIVCGLRL